MIWAKADIRALPRVGWAARPRRVQPDAHEALTAGTTQYEIQKPSGEDIAGVAVASTPPHHVSVNTANAFESLRDDLNAFATGQCAFTLDACHGFIDYAAQIIRTHTGQITQRCNQHLANATTAAANDELPRFIHEVEAAMMQCSNTKTPT
ncbi:MAG: hypothetical protein HOP09_18970 [Hyphomicrobium sp.]|nr:hypothetical protein [Hyphomicrobium sp.]